MSSPRTPRIQVRDSAIHGRGVYAARDLRQGEQLIEYKGERISWKEADRRPPSNPSDPNHTFFFSLSDGKTVIDASVDGNSARWINHSCQPNCEAEETDDGRIFIRTLRDIASGEELNYDYGLIIDEPLTKKLKQAYECRCGNDNCRGTMLNTEKKAKPAKKAVKKADADKTESKAKTPKKADAKAGAKPEAKAEKSASKPPAKKSKSSQ
ncbi:MAG: SET domain-containing protein-lysine N-methyltransferase [Burkholderiaceae bacterium]